MEAEQLNFLFSPMQLEGIEYIANEISNKNTVSNDFNGWVGMKEFEKQSNRSRTTIAKLLNRPEIIKKVSVDYGGWVFYPCDNGKWSFHYKEMMEFINNEFYRKYSGGTN